MTDVQPRKRPRQQRSGATVSAILEAAARILERDGLDALNTNAVAERAGVSVGSLYQYFPGKAALLAELIRRERAILAERFCVIAAHPPPDLQSLVVAMVDVAVAHQLERPALARALDFVEPSLPLGSETTALNDRLGATIAGLLAARGIASPDKAAGDLFALARGMIDAAGLAAETDRADLTARVTRAALGYLQPAPVVPLPPRAPCLNNPA